MTQTTTIKLIASSVRVTTPDLSASLEAFEADIQSDATGNTKLASDLFQTEDSEDCNNASEDC